MDYIQQIDRGSLLVKKRNIIRNQNEPVFEKDQLETLDDVLVVIGAHFIIQRCSLCGYNPKILEEVNIDIVGVDLKMLNKYCQNFIKSPTVIH